MLIVVIFWGLSMAGCQQQGDYSSTLRYRPGTWYEYRQLLDAWIPNNGTPPPLPPVSDSSVSGWVRVSDTGEILSYEPEPYCVNCDYPHLYFSGGYSHGHGGHLGLHHTMYPYGYRRPYYYSGYMRRYRWRYYYGYGYYPGW